MIPRHCALCCTACFGMKRDIKFQIAWYNLQDSVDNIDKHVIKIDQILAINF